MHSCALLLLVCIGAGAAVRVVLFVQPIGGDPAIYAYVGQRILAGDLPYRDVFEQKPPGVLYTYAAAFRIFGTSMRAVQYADLISWAVVVAGMGAVGWRLWREKTPAYLAAALGAVFVNPNLQSSYKQVGQSEAFIAALTMWALWAVAGAGGIGGSIAAGFLCGLAVLFKYNAATFAIACALVAIQRAGWRRGFVPFVTGCIVAPLWCVIYFGSAGALRDLFDATVFYNIVYAGASHASFTAFLMDAARTTWVFATGHFAWTLGLGGIALLLWKALRGDRSGVPLCYACAAGYASILLNARFYPQYFLQVLPLLLVSSAFLLWTLARSLRSRMPAVVAAGLGVLLAAAAARHTPIRRLTADVRAAAAFRRSTLPLERYYERFGGYATGGDFSMLADYRVARMIRSGTRPGDTVYIYGGEPLVLFLAGRRSASRFVWNDPFVAGAYKGRFTEHDLVGELQRSRPVYVAVLRNDQNAVDPVESLEYFRRSSVLRPYVERHYRELGWVEDFLLFTRTSR